MNIVYCGCFRLPNFDAAAPRVINNARAMKHCGNKITFISWGGDYRPEDKCRDGRYCIDDMEYIVTHEIDQNGLFSKLLGRIVKGRRTIQVIKNLSEKPDLIILYNANNSFAKLMLSYCNKNGIKLANDITEWYDNNEIYLVDILSNYINMTRTQRSIKNKIVISTFLNEYYPDSNNIQIPPLCDPEEPKWMATVEDERIKPFDGITLIYAGNPAKKDCIHTVINAVNTLANEGHSIRFLILGITRDNYMKQHSKSLMNILLHENVMFLGRVSQDLIPAYYKKADFMVLLREPTRKNMAGFPTKFAESMTAGVPVITNATSDLLNYMINGKTGFIVDGYDYDSILFTLKNSVLTIRKCEIDDMKSYVQCVNTTFNWHLHVADFRLFLQKLR